MTTSELTAPTAVIADPCWIARYGVRAVLEGGGFRVAGEAESGAQAVAMAGQFQPVLVVLAAQFPGESGAGVCRAVAEAAPDSRILVLSDSEDSGTLLALFHAGASGAVDKSEGPAKLLAVAQAVAHGEYRVPAPVMQLVITVNFRAGHSQSQGKALSTVERETLALFAVGLSYAAIGKRYNRTRSAIANRLNRIRRKLGARNKQELVVWAYRNWVVD